MIIAGADPNLPRKYVQTILGKPREIQMYLLEEILNLQNIDLIRFLIAYGAHASLGYPLILIMQILIMQTDKPNFEIAKLLIAHGADVNEQISDDGTTAVMLATGLQNPEAVQFLIDHGANIDLSNKDGETAVTIAQEKGNEEILRILNEAKNRLLE